jgi:hypothetical protein
MRFNPFTLFEGISISDTCLWDIFKTVYFSFSGREINRIIKAAGYDARMRELERHGEVEHMVGLLEYCTAGIVSLGLFSLSRIAVAMVESKNGFFVALGALLMIPGFPLFLIGKIALGIPSAILAVVISPFVYLLSRVGREDPLCGSQYSPVSMSDDVPALTPMWEMNERGVHLRIQTSPPGTPPSPEPGALILSPEPGAAMSDSFVSIPLTPNVTI